MDAARRIQDLGRGLDQPDLMALGLNGEGRALIRSGHVVDGLKLLDEAMVTVLDGRLAPFASGTLYCHTIATCHEVADIRRMSRWIDLTEQWLATLPRRWRSGACAGCTGLSSSCSAASGTRPSGTRCRSGGPRRQPDRLRRGGLVRRGRGAPVARRPSAADAYDGHAAGVTRSRDVRCCGSRMATPRAPRVVRAALAAVGPDPCAGPRCVLRRSRSRSPRDGWMTRRPRLRARETASTYATSGLEAMAAAARGAVLLSEDRAEEALPVLRDACRRWHELGAAYDAAGTCVRLAEAYRALGDEASAAAEVARAEATYERLGSYRPARNCRRADAARGRGADTCGRRTLQPADRRGALHQRPHGRPAPDKHLHQDRCHLRTQAARYAIDRGMTGTR